MKVRLKQYPVTGAILLFFLALLDSAELFQETSTEFPHIKIGPCVLTKRCEFLLKLLKPSSEPSVVLTNTTDWPLDDILSKVCCPAVFYAKKMPVESVLPERCGEYVDRRIIGGRIAGLNEFPWTALVEYDTPQGLLMSCGGTVISNRYVLTAAHCLVDLRLKWLVIGLRLGEYNTRTAPDCVTNSKDVEYCAPHAIRVLIEETILHESFKSPERYSNDIALLRTMQIIPFSEFIKPICLPQFSAPSAYYELAGWGLTESSKVSDIKRKLVLPYVTLEQCADVYKQMGIIIGEGQMCAGGQPGKDTCSGDSGGALMRKESPTKGVIRWAIAGILSFGTTPCAIPGWPGVYTKVYDYLPWIHKHLKP